MKKPKMKPRRRISIKKAALDPRFWDTTVLTEGTTAMVKRKAKPTKMIRVPLLSAVLVWWLDAAVTPGWHDGNRLSEIKLGPVLSSGILVHEDRQRIVLAMNIDGAGDSGHCFAIPRCQIIKIEATRGPEAI